MSDCVFCKIGAGEIPTPTVYEDDSALAFIDLHPLNPGHTLVIPKAHSETFLDMSTEEFARFMDVVHRVAKKVHAAFPTPRLSILTKGFDVPHTHVHLIPLSANGDLISGRFGEHLPPEAPLDVREAMAEKIKKVS